MMDVAALAADSMQGRAEGTEGIDKARNYISRRYSELGLTQWRKNFRHPFQYRLSNRTISGENIVAYIPGGDFPDRYFVITAHYDHLGIRDGQIYNGADDNASGVSALFAIARHFRKNEPRHSVLFVALDAEEVRLQGAKAFVESPPVPIEQMIVNINMDMISRNDGGALFACGTYHYPALRPPLEAVANRSPLCLQFGHDEPGIGKPDDWTMLSDHAEFHKRNIPFVYFGVEDHPDYHQPGDDVEKINAEFFVASVETILDAVTVFDIELN